MSLLITAGIKGMNSNSYSTLTHTAYCSQCKKKLGQVIKYTDFTDQQVYEDFNKEWKFCPYCAESLDERIELE